MSEITRVALDAMGGDNAPGEIVKGAVEAVQRRDDIKILLTGKEEVLKKERGSLQLGSRFLRAAGNGMRN